MRETASVISEGRFDSITLGFVSGGRENDISRLFAQMFHDALRTVYSESEGTVSVDRDRSRGNLGDDAPLTKREDGRVGILERHADSIDFAKKKAVRIVADVGCNGKGVPHCRIFAQKVPPDAGIRTLNAALVVMRNFYECAVATRNVLCEKYPKIAKYLNERFAIEKDEKSLEGG